MHKSIGSADGVPAGGWRDAVAARALPSSGSALDADAPLPAHPTCPPRSWDDWKKTQDEAAAREQAMEQAVALAESERARARQPAWGLQPR